MSNAGLLPWEGEDELVEAKAHALAAQQACLTNGGRPVETDEQPNGPAKTPACDADAPSDITPPDLPEISAFVRSLGGLNSVAIFKDLLAADLLTHRAGHYQQRSRRSGDAEWFRSVKMYRGHALYVTPAGQELIKQLKKDGRLTKALTKQPLTPQQKKAREKARKVAKDKREAARAALAANQPAVLAKLDQTIEECIHRRGALRERLSLRSLPVAG
ncbi:hypothetical protein K6Y74_38330 [Burkholderia cenocepacia]|uniref:hypothetical protein n=1 Tax=Burkholderia cenocepacia TaxID=95486 RepID=UPI00078CA2E5|nr:hypothetical protein [Burkholderia cenocepacia]AMU14610.1 hypothetical protein A3203_16620 [Burkholderia cenocepacia]MCW3587678.1 hypothetical protein [Burkholderia cenocepacia]MCW3632522.1 hypothetical protein [Burkholderia cenocepacia]MCW3649093.1 hypothetical protein [Burkholderia cenocepacia]MCW5182469.1 hypothetical protein [Burkholderia cenocepacia]